MSTVPRSSRATTFTEEPMILPALRPEFEPTRATLHAYAECLAAVPRAHGVTHPRWWHIGLDVRPDGLATRPVPLPGGGAMGFRMDLRRHLIEIHTSTGFDDRLDMRSGATATEVGERLVSVGQDHGLADDYDRDRFEDDEPRRYDPEAAGTYFAAFVDAHLLFERRRVTLGERVGPILLWPHGFDLAFEWYGTRAVEEDGDLLPAQLNLGLYPEGSPYFYSSPWPFDDALLDSPLPHGATWHTEGWRGAMLPYHRVADDPEGPTRLADFARAVFDAARPTLEAT